MAEKSTGVRRRRTSAPRALHSGMSRTEPALRAARDAGRHAVIPFVCGGFPSPGVTERTLAALSELGCPVIEVGIPFSDPIADGPVIAAAMHAALNPPAGSGWAPATPSAVMSEVARARPHVRSAIVAMVSYSIVAKVGEERFVQDAVSAGFDGLIVPDLPLEESGALRDLTARAGCSLSLLVAPTTAAARAADIAKACTGFVYVLARTGITGTATKPGTEAAGSNELGPRVSALRPTTSLPIACGFGISTRADVERVLQHADAAIVGSALVSAMGNATEKKLDPVAAATEFVRHLL
jgi:tryptophan synthase alpha chain